MGFASGKRTMFTSTWGFIAIVITSLMSTEISEAGFGFRVCESSFGHSISVGRFTIDYQVNNNRYSCVIDGAREYGKAYTCESNRQLGRCQGSMDFMQISNDNPGDALAYCAIIFDGEEIAVAREWKVGDGAGQFKRRYNMNPWRNVPEIYSIDNRPSGFSHTGRVAPACSPLPITGFGFRVCGDPRWGHTISGGKFTIDYQVGTKRYSCVIDGADHYNGVYTCASVRETDSCLNGEFIQISNDGNDDLAYCSLIFDGQKFELPDGWKVGDDAGTYKRRYNMKNGRIVSEDTKPKGYNTQNRVEPECCKTVDCFEQ